MIPIKTESAWRGTADCRACGIRDMVLFADLKEEDFNLIHAPIDDLEHPAGHALVRMGETATSLYTLRAGVVKLVRNTVDGRQRIVRVLRAGDVIGLEALMGPTYDSDAIGLTSIKVCRLPLQVIQRLNRETPRLHQRLLERWHRSLKEADDWLADLNFGTARQRVAGLVLKMRAEHDAVGVHPVFARRHGRHARPEAGDGEPHAQRLRARRRCWRRWTTMAASTAWSIPICCCRPNPEL